MTNKRLIIFFVIVLLLLAATFRPAGDKKFSNSSWGLTFNYPKNYLLSSRGIVGTDRSYNQLTLVDRSFRGGDEGPTAITVDVYPKNSNTESLDDWLKTTNESNFKLSNGTYATTTVIGQPAIEYDWDGLYRGHTVAVEWGNNIFAFSVTYLTSDEQIRRDLVKILSSITWRSSTGRQI